MILQQHGLPVGTQFAPPGQQSRKRQPGRGSPRLTDGDDLVFFKRIAAIEADEKTKRYRPTSGDSIHSTAIRWLERLPGKQLRYPNFHVSVMPHLFLLDR